MGTSNVAGNLAVTSVGAITDTGGLTVAGTSNFSTGSDSPVRMDWLMNKSLDCSRRTSAGTMSPAHKRMTSPGTSSLIGSSIIDAAAGLR